MTSATLPTSPNTLYPSQKATNLFQARSALSEAMLAPTNHLLRKLLWEIAIQLITQLWHVCLIWHRGFHNCSLSFMSGRITYYCVSFCLIFSHYNLLSLMITAWLIDGLINGQFQIFPADQRRWGNSLDTVTVILLSFPLWDWLHLYCKNHGF